MVIRTKKNAPALKHGGYSAATLLPGEDPGALKKLHDAVLAEFSPAGALEEDIVASIARLVWRKRHLATFRVVGTARNEAMANRADVDPEEARKKYEALIKERNAILEGNADSVRRDEDNPAGINRSDTPQEAMNKYIAYINQDRSIAPEQEFFRAGEIATMEQLMSVLAVEERLDAMIDRCLKRLLFLRGLKSLAPTKPSSPPPNQKRLRSV